MEKNLETKSVKSPRVTKLHIPFITFLKIFIAGFVAFCIFKLASIFLLLVLALLIATTLYPLLEWMVAKGINRTVAFFVIAIGTLGIFGIFLGVIVPAIVEQLTELPEHFTRVTKELSEKVQDESLRKKMDGILKKPQSIVGDIPTKLLAFSASIMSAVFSVGVVLIVALYLVADGRKTYAWIRAFFPDSTQRKLDATAEEMQKIISAYVAGQIITSLLVAVFVFGLLTITGVPAALSVAVLSALFDALPLLGFLVSIVAAGALALTVSTSTAITVTLAFVGYHALENYYIVPKVYGHRMRLSGLVVLLSLIVAIEVGGVLAGLLILPIIAAYPVIEKIWLRRAVGSDTIAAHVELNETAKPTPGVD